MCLVGVSRSESRLRNREADLSFLDTITTGTANLTLWTHPSQIEFIALGKRRVKLRKFLRRFIHVEHSPAVPEPGSSRRWIWNRERRSAPAESQHSFPSSIGRPAPSSNIYPTGPPPSAQGNRC